MQLLLWTLTCLLVAVLASRQVFALCCVTLVLWCLVPGVAGHRLTGTQLSLSGVHPAAILALAVLGVSLLAVRGELQAALQARPTWLWAAGLVVVAATAMGLAADLSLASLVPVVNQLLGPLSLFFLLGGALLLRPQRAAALRRLLLVIAAVESAVALWESAAGGPLLWLADYQRQYWFTDGYARSMGTLDHPLTLSLLLSSSVFLLAPVRSWWTTVVLALLLAAGLLTTQSRVGLVVAAIGLGYLLVRSRMHVVGRLGLAVVAVSAAATAYALGAAADLLARINDDSGSSSARADAFGYFGRHWADHVWTGAGLDSSFERAAEVGLATSFESSLLMYAVDLGLVLTLFYLGWILSVALRATGAPLARGAVGAALAALLTAQTFSALSGNTAVPALLWTILVLPGFAAALPLTGSGSAAGAADAPARETAPTRR